MSVFQLGGIERTMHRAIQTLAALQKQESYLWTYGNIDNFSLGFLNVAIDVTIYAAKQIGIRHQVP